MNGTPVRIVVDASSPRLNYVLEILFREMLGRDFEVIVRDALAEGFPDADLFYLEQPPAGVFAIQCTGYLTSNNLLPPPVFPDILYEIPSFSEFDLFSWVFYKLILPHQYRFTHHDDAMERAEKDRNRMVSDLSGGAAPGAASGQEQKGLRGQILVEDLAATLGKQLGIEMPKRTFDYEITIDVDNPWKHRHKPFHVRWGGWLRDVLRGNREGARERWQSIMKGVDPFDTDDLIIDWCPTDRTTLFYLVDGNEPEDSRYNLRMVPYQKRVLKMQQAGFFIGVHPSYGTWFHETMLTNEITLLWDLIGPVRRSRQHYLRYALATTFRVLWEQGIDHEYSICPKDDTGAMNAIMRPYPWYNMSTESVTDLVLVPAVVMDRSLQQYLGLNPEQALARIKEEIAEVRRVGGKFVVILHNETFSESGEWKGWRKVIRGMLDDLQADGSKA